MANIIIDNQTYDLDPRQNLLEAALSVGLDLPYFCWHPALGSVGSCRQCAVQQFADESDSQGRTVMACMTPVVAFMRCSIAHPTAVSFRKQVIEWMMINHPHDCPVCDEGGECHLQDMTVMTGHTSRRHRFAKRTFVNQNLGPFINHEMNRCITCYRCVRFYKDVAGGDDLHAFKSSDRVYFGRHEEGALASGFSGNLVEVCPTGVFTDKVFHKMYTRKWDLATAPSICQLCSVGCNISPGERYGDLRRVQNRYHPDVNGYFLCDRGRFGHEFVNATERITARSDDNLAKVKSLVQQANRVIGIGSPRASLEANWLLKKWVGANNFYDGLDAHQSAVQAQILALMNSKSIHFASLRDVSMADAILIVGEDITHTAPMMALSVRQAINAHKKDLAEQELKIPAWNDAAVRDYTRECSLPIFMAGVMSTGLDDVVKPHANIIVHPDELIKLVKNLTALIAGGDVDPAWPKNLSSWLTDTKESLLKAKMPVLIGGASLGEPVLIDLLADLAGVLDKIDQGKTKLSFVSNEGNSIGLGLLEPKPLVDLGGDSIDVAVVLENDLHWRLGEKAFKKLTQKVKNLVVIDSLHNGTTAAAAVILPCLTFAESTGTLVSQEGRMQRYFSVFQGKNEQLSSFRLIASCMGELGKKWHNVDDIDADLAADFGWPKDIFDCLFKADYKVDGHGIPRFTNEFSGRTAMNADVTMHEPRPIADPDSPLIYSMEGARKRVPLPLVSSSWAPRWNSVQSLFKQAKETSGVTLFDKINVAVHQPSRSNSKARMTKLPEVYVLPKHHIFGSEERARFSPSLASRIMPVVAHLSLRDAQKLNIRPGSKISLKRDGESHLFWITIEKNLSDGILALPFGLVDAALFYRQAIIEEVL